MVKIIVDYYQIDFSMIHDVVVIVNLVAKIMNEEIEEEVVLDVLLDLNNLEKIILVAAVKHFVEGNVVANEVSIEVEVI